MADVDDSIFVFRDADGKRWPRFRLFFLLSSLIVFLGTVVFVSFLFVTPQLRLPEAVLRLRAHLQSNHAQKRAEPPAAPKPLWLRFGKANPLPSAAARPALPALSAPEQNLTHQGIRLGYYVGWDPSSLENLTTHAAQLTHVTPEWLTITDGEGNLESKADPQLLAVVESKHLTVIPQLTNLMDNAWQSEAVENLANGPLLRQEKFIATLLLQLKKIGAGGVLIDWNQIDPAYREPLTTLLTRIASALHQENMELWLSVPVGLELKAFDLQGLAAVVDHFVAHLHDENSEIDPPGPVASQPWFEGWLQTLLGYGRPEQWIIAIGTYGYDWQQGHKQAESLSFSDAMTRAGRAGILACQSTPPLTNPTFSYLEATSEHTVWFLDAVTFLNQAQAALRLKVGGIAIARLGNEDPAIWPAMALLKPTPLSAAELSFLKTILPGNEVSQLGKGNFLTVDEHQSNGFRTITPASDGLLTTSYEVFPTYKNIAHQGQGQPDQIALSFDDGPDPKWTPAILDVLRAKGVKASFFMVGDRMENYPSLLSRIQREGHELGVHTYTHPNLAAVSAERARMELNATQRLIETVTGHSTFLFRPPYVADSQPQKPEELLPLQIAQSLGYLTVSADIDTEDWSRPGVAAIVQRVKELRGQGNVILLHDAGGDRSQTVAALPLIIEYLQERGDRIVSLGELLGAPADSLMPPLPRNEQPLLRVIRDYGFRIMHYIEELGWSFMIVATILVSLRTLFVACLAQLHRHHQHKVDSRPPTFHPPISIVVAAFNEEKVIGRTIESLLHTDYPGEMELLVVDDGSTDHTADLVEAMIGQTPGLRLLRQANTGKAGALRVGFQAAAHEIIVTLDADTHFQPDTITRLVEPMRDQRLGAVSGHVKVGNQQRLLARFQALEYTCGFNLDRRAYQQLQCITVVPGAVSVWRRSAVLAAGGISSDTLAEDTDLTLSLHRAGYRIGYAPRAIAWTEAPETFAALLKQRFRWGFGTLQCLWKHRDLIGNSRHKALGWFALPSIWFFQILLVAIGPLVDLLLCFSLLFGMGVAIFIYLLVFLLMDLLLAALACHMEEEPLWLAWRILPMRFLYRPLLAWVIWKSIIKALKGALVGWGKLERSASIALKVQPTETIR